MALLIKAFLCGLLSWLGAIAWYRIIGVVSYALEWPGDCTIVTMQRFFSVAFFLIGMWGGAIMAKIQNPNPNASIELLMLKIDSLESKIDKLSG
jgi:hypothetical protein